MKYGMIEPKHNVSGISWIIEGGLNQGRAKLGTVTPISRCDQVLIGSIAAAFAAVSDVIVQSKPSEGIRGKELEKEMGMDKYFIGGHNGTGLTC